MKIKILVTLFVISIITNIWTVHLYKKEKEVENLVHSYLIDRIEQPILSAGVPPYLIKKEYTEEELLSVEKVLHRAEAHLKDADYLLQMIFVHYEHQDNKEFNEEKYAGLLRVYSQYLFELNSKIEEKQYEEAEQMIQIYVHDHKVLMNYLVEYNQKGISEFSENELNKHWGKMIKELKLNNEDMKRYKRAEWGL